VRILLAGSLVLAALVVAAPANATNECRGLNPCVAVAGPWVVVEARPATVQFQLACPRGYAVGGTDAELTDRAIDLSFMAVSGAPVSPGITTGQTLVFMATYAGTSARPSTFRPHIGCIPASGGRRTPTAAVPIVPPGMPTMRRVVTTRVAGAKGISSSCRANERLVAWYATRAFGTAAPPAPALVAGLTLTGRRAGNSATVLAHARRGQAIVQVGAVCAGGHEP
jgi:hypothetical protein